MAYILKVGYIPLAFSGMMRYSGIMKTNYNPAQEGIEAAQEDNRQRARLIAAAPEMLSALYDALPFVEDRLHDRDFKPGTVKKYADAIRAVIAKVEGRQ